MTYGIEEEIRLIFVYHLITIQFYKKIKSFVYNIDGTTVLGWRPRRTLVFCSWGAEEYGLIGSYEWVEVGTLLNISFSQFLLDFRW